MKWMLWFGTAFIIISALFYSNLPFSLNSISAQEFIPDMQMLHAYSAEELMAMLEKMGEQGRSNYLKFHMLDYVYIFVFVGLLISILRFVYEAGWVRNLLIFVAILAGLFDLSEDLSLDFLFLKPYPNVCHDMADIVGQFTFWKFNMIFLAATGIFLGAIRNIYLRFFP